MKDGSVSLCMIVKDEGPNLASCLDSVRGLANELIVVDTGSSDGTAEIAARHGAEVVPFDFSRVDFAAARNCALGRATGRWILALDADEMLDPAGVPLIEELVTRDENAGYFLERHNRWAGSDKTTRDYVVRLFPNRPE